jgi:DNA-binding IclR family transcriptional regulator
MHQAGPRPGSASKTASRDGRYAAPALKKGLEIIEALASQSSALSLTEIAKQLGYTVNEIFRMVVALEEQDYIHLGEDEKYRLTLKLFELVHRQQPLRSVVATALPLMRELANQRRQSCHLAVYHDGRSMIVAQVDSPERWTFNVKVGAMVGLLDTASGLVLLAYSDSATREQLLAAHENLPGSLPVNHQALAEQIAAIREAGYWVRPSQQTMGVTNIACPIFGADDQVAAALTVPYVARLDEARTPSIEETTELLRVICARISKLMGCGAGALTPFS